MEKLFRLYIACFGKPAFRKLNYFFFKLGLKGLGFLNHASFKESGEYFFLKHLLAKNEIQNIFDVGAFHGAYTEAIIDLDFRGTVHTFEPHPDNYAFLSNKFKTSDKSYLHNFGFSDSNEDAELYDYADTDGSSHATMYQEVLGELMRRDTQVKKIQLKTIDSFLEENPAIERVSFLKIDTEGNEMKVLRGAQATLDAKKIDVIQFEVGINNIISRVLLRDFVELLADFDLFRMLPKGLLPITYNMPFLEEIMAYQNIVAIRKGSGIRI